MYLSAATRKILVFQQLRQFTRPSAEAGKATGALGPTLSRLLMNVRIKATLEFSITEGAMEDALAEYDEITVEGAIREVLDKAIAVDDIEVKVIEGPNTLEEYDQQSGS
jgi:hypothetical protein